MEIRKLLYISQSGPAGEEGLRTLLAFRELGLEEILLVSLGGKGGSRPLMEDAGVGLREVAGEGLTPAGIVSLAAKERVSMIAGGLRERSGGGAGTKFGRKLIQLSSLPILLIPALENGRPEPEKIVFSKVLFATKWEPIADRALKFLLECKELIQELEIVTVINRKLSIRDMIQLKKLIEDTRREFLDRGIDAEAHIYAGKPSDEIILASKDYHADCIVMGATRSKGLRRFLYRGCTYEVAGKSHLPIMVVP